MYLPGSRPGDFGEKSRASRLPRGEGAGNDPLLATPKQPIAPAAGSKSVKDAKDAKDAKGPRVTPLSADHAPALVGNSWQRLASARLFAQARAGATRLAGPVSRSV